MKIKPGTALRVSLAFAPDAPIVVGRLALDASVAVLEYASSFLDTGLSINPLFEAPGPRLLWAKNPRAFDGLHGIIADSLPDAWGSLLVRRRAQTNGISYSALTVLDKLAIVGQRGFGALVYEPQIAEDEVGEIDLDLLAGQSIALEEGRDTQALADLERLGGSSGGARPKVLVGINERGELSPGDARLPTGFAAWIVKFRSSRYDVEDAGPLEAAYAAMARASGLNISETRLIAGRKSASGYFATKRFDRLADNRRVHIASAAALLDTPWDVPTIDYDDLLRLTRAITRDQPAVERAFDRMVFNVIAHNRDDHAKQHTFSMDASGKWTLAPPYDLTFARGPGLEHYLAVNGHAGDDITLRDLTALGERHDVPADRIRAALDRVTSAVSDFPVYARDYGVTSSTLKEVENDLRRDRKRLAASRSQ